MSFPFLIGFRNNEPPIVEEIEKQRGDFVIVHPDMRAEIVDTSVVNPNVRNYPEAAENAGAAAEKRRQEKVESYKRWLLHGSTTLVVGSFEAFGRWEPTLLEHYKRFVKSAFPDKKNRQYVYQLKMTVQRVSVALQRAIGEASVLFNRRARAFPAVAMGPAAEEHAATFTFPPHN